MDPNISMIENDESLKPDPIIGDRTVWKELDKNFFKTKDGGFSFEPPERYYYIAPHGVIVSMLYRKPHLMKGRLQNGYPRFMFQNNGSKKTVFCIDLYVTIFAEFSQKMKRKIR